MTAMTPLTPATPARPTTDRETGPAPAPSYYSATNATRLMCAGTYLDAGFRKLVISELMGNQYRVVAPSYGYDAVPVLAHALAAQRLRHLQVLGTFGCFLVIVLLYTHGAVGVIGSLVLLLWSAWALGFLRRLVTLDTMIRRLRPQAGLGYDGRFPENEHLTPALVAKIDLEQVADRNLIYYGGYKPFVGAGRSLGEWANAELLIAAPVNQFLSLGAGGADFGSSSDIGSGTDAPLRARGRMIPFTVAEITSYVAEQMVSELLDSAKDAEKIRKLTVEKCRFTKATGKHHPDTDVAHLRQSDIHWEENYDAAREYLCIRVGSWEQEIVTSMFVGFDIKGNTLHTEFYPYVLQPIKGGFHIVNQLPDSVDKVVFKAARDALLAAPFDLVGMVFNPFGDRLPRVIEEAGAIGSGGRTAAGLSDLGLAGYASPVLNRGAVASVREMAMTTGYHHFFQKSDTVKYRQIVERRLLQIIETFLDEHNVDLRDHHATQTNILNQAYGAVTAYGDNAVVSQGNSNKLFSRQSHTQDIPKEAIH